MIGPYVCCLPNVSSLKWDLYMHEGKDVVHTGRLDLPVLSYELHFQMIHCWKSGTVRLKMNLKSITQSVSPFLCRLLESLYHVLCLFSSLCFCRVLKMLRSERSVKTPDAYMMVLCYHYSRKCLRVGDKTTLRGFSG